MNLPKPKNQNQAVLYRLIKSGKTSYKTFRWPGYRTRISNLKLIHKVPIEPKRVQEKKPNQFGEKYSYIVHTLPVGKRDLAIGIYLQMVKNVA